MISELFNSPLAFLFWFLALIIAITIHEFAHAYAADRLGDPTPRLMGRLTLDPRSHLDPIGTLMILFARFGWGKPVQFDPYNLENPKRDSAIISLAGPASNLLLAAAASILLHALNRFGLSLFGNSISVLPTLLFAFLQPVIMMNVILAIFNLVPIHPLDGFKIVGGLLPNEYARQWQELESYGMIFLIFLIFPLFGGASPISQLISPPINFLLNILLPSTPLI